MRLEGKKISCDSVYRMVKEDRESGGTLYLHLRRKGKPYRKRGYRSSGRGLIPNRVPIDQRPAEVESKETFGHWEADTIVSRGRQGGFFTLVERKTKYTFVFPIRTRRAEEIEKKANILRAKHSVFKSITFDNGKEFSKHVELSRVLQTTCYFANPYHSWERGLNEHTNGLIREFFPKKMNLNKVSLAETRKLEKKLNKRPRKVLNFRTPQEVFSQELKGNKISCNR
jgi:IS30 family transposase